MKQKILFIMHMPPPVHGAAMVGQYIHDSKLINDKFDSHYINLTTAKNLQDIGKVGIRKLVDFIMLLRRIRKSLKEIRPDLVYVTLNACGGAFYKDYIVKGIKVILLSECLYSDVMKYVKREDVFVFPTFYHNECFPLVLLEAMQHHLPCISTTEGGIPGIIDDKETGFLIEKHDFQTLADKLEFFIEHPEESERMGENGYRKFNDKFTLRKFEESMVDILNDCLKG